MNTDLSTSEMLTELRALAAAHLGDLDVETVPSIQEWCHARGLAENNPFRCGAVNRPGFRGAQEFCAAPSAT